MPAPKKPATTPSLPGAQSTRTDGGIADKQVIRQLTGWNPSDTDTNASFAQTESGAPMAQTPSTPMPSKTAVDKAAQTMGQAQAMPTLDGMSQRPWEHVTTPAQPMQPVDPRVAENTALVQRYLPDLQAALNIPGVPDSYRRFVNFLSQQASQASNQ